MSVRFPGRGNLLTHTDTAAGCGSNRSEKFDGGGKRDTNWLGIVQTENIISSIKRQEIWTVKTPLNNDNNCTNSRCSFFFFLQTADFLADFISECYFYFILFFFPSIIWFNSSQVENTGFRSWCGLRCLSRDSSGRRQRAAPPGPPPPTPTTPPPSQWSLWT